MSDKSSTGRRGRVSWCLYDWANSAFPTVITTFVFATYFAEAIASDKTSGTAQWGYAMAAAGLAVAILAPVMGAISDQAGGRKPWLGCFTAIAVIGSGLLWFATPEAGSLVYALVVVAIATVAFELAGVFYNAMLPDLTTADRLGRLSGWGWGVGYFGGIGCLGVALALVQPETPPFGLDKASAEHVRATTLLVAAWYAVFAVPIFVFTPDTRRPARAARAAVRAGLAQLWATMRRLRAHRQIALFLAARMAYTDGLNTLFAFGGIYAAGTFGMSFAEIIQFAIALNVAAGLGAFGFGWIDDRIGAKPTLIVSLLALIALAGGLVVVEDKAWFWALGMGLGIFVGPAQSASRSMMARLAPAELRTEMFGLYALSGKATAFAGPLLVGWLTLAFDSQRAGMASIIAFWLVGIALLTLVREPK